MCGRQGGLESGSQCLQAPAIHAAAFFETRDCMGLIQSNWPKVGFL